MIGHHTRGDQWDQAEESTEHGPQVTVAAFALRDQTRRPTKTGHDCKQDENWHLNPPDALSVHCLPTSEWGGRVDTPRSEPRPSRSRSRARSTGLVRDPFGVRTSR